MKKEKLIKALELMDNTPIIREKFISKLASNYIDKFKNIEISIEDITMINNLIPKYKNNNLSKQEKYELEELSFKLKNKQEELLLILKELTQILKILDSLEKKEKLLFEDKILELTDIINIIKQFLLAIEILIQNKILIEN